MILSDGPARAEVPQFPTPTVAGSGDFEEAEALLERKKWSEAAVVFRSVLRKSPDFTPAAMGLARALAFSGRREEAVSTLWRYADRERGARKAAIVERARVISRQFLTATTFQAYQDGLSLLEGRKYRQARDRLEAALAQEPDNVEILTRLGQSLALEGDYDSATEHLRTARRLNPHEPEVRLWLGRTMHQRGEIKEAVDELRSAASQLPSSEVAPVWLAAALFSYGQKNQAIQILEETVKSRPLLIQPLINLAWLRSQQAQLAQLGSRDNQALWTAKRELQQALTRLEQAPPKENSQGQGDLGLSLHQTASELKSEAMKVLVAVEEKLGRSGREEQKNPAQPES